MVPSAADTTPSGSGLSTTGLGSDPQPLLEGPVQPGAASVTLSVLLSPLGVSRSRGQADGGLPPIHEPSGEESPTASVPAARLRASPHAQSGPSGPKMSLPLGEDSCPSVRAHTQIGTTHSVISKDTQAARVTQTLSPHPRLPAGSRQPRHRLGDLSAHPRAHGRPPSRSEKRSHQRRRALWRGRRPRSGSALGSGGGGRGRRRRPRSTRRSRRSRRSVGTATSEARAGAAAAVSSRRGAPGARRRPASAPRTAPAARAERRAAPRAPGSPRRPQARRPLRSRRRPGTKAPGKTWRPRLAGAGARRTAGASRWECAKGPEVALPGAHEHHAPADARPAFFLLLRPRRLRPQDRQHRRGAEHAEARADVPRGCEPGQQAAWLLEDPAQRHLRHPQAQRHPDGLVGVRRPHLQPGARPPQGSRWASSCPSPAAPPSSLLHPRASRRPAFIPSFPPLSPSPWEGTRRAGLAARPPS